MAYEEGTNNYEDSNTIRTALYLYGATEGPVNVILVPV